MKPTKAIAIIGYVLLAAGTGAATTYTLIGRGLATPLSPLNLSITLTAVGVVLVVLAIPMIRYRVALKNPKVKPKRVPPFYAIRVVALAKATSVAGSLFFGWHLGVLAMQLTRPEPKLAPTITGLIASGIALAAGIVVEQLFKIPPDQTDVEGTPA